MRSGGWEYVVQQVELREGGDRKGKGRERSEKGGKVGWEKERRDCKEKKEG